MYFILCHNVRVSIIASVANALLLLVLYTLIIKLLYNSTVSMVTDATYFYYDNNIILML